MTKNQTTMSRLLRSEWKSVVLNKPKDNRGESTTFISIRMRGGVVFAVLKGYFRLFEMGLYEVLIHSQCFTFSRWRSACPQFGEAERSTDVGS